MFNLMSASEMLGVERDSANGILPPLEYIGHYVCNRPQFPTYRDSENAVCFRGFGDCPHTPAIGAFPDQPLLCSIQSVLMTETGVVSGMATFIMRCRSRYVANWVDCRMAAFGWPKSDSGRRQENYIR